MFALMVGVRVLLSISRESVVPLIMLGVVVVGIMVMTVVSMVFVPVIVVGVVFMLLG